jgi:hypothetical protein
MGSFRRIAVTCVGALVATAMSIGSATGAGALPRKLTPGTDPCTVLTDTDLAGLSTPFTISSSTSELEHVCTYTLENDEGPTPLQLSVNSSIGYSAQKAVTKKLKKVSGLPGGYTGTVNGGNEAAYKSGKASVLLQDSDLSSADLVKILTAIHKRLG